MKDQLSDHLYKETKSKMLKIDPQAQANKLMDNKRPMNLAKNLSTITSFHKINNDVKLFQGSGIQPNFNKFQFLRKDNGIHIMHYNQPQNK
jgi:hypothetical protein